MAFSLFPSTSGNSAISYPTSTQTEQLNKAGKPVSDVDSINRLIDAIYSDREWNSAEAEKNRNWQERMSNTAVRRAFEDIQAAGLNPWLALQGSSALSASTPSGDSASAYGTSAMSSLLGTIISSDKKMVTELFKSFMSTINSSIKAMASGE